MCQWNRGRTPPGFWSMEFPTTQQVQVQNREAERMNAEKEAQIRPRGCVSLRSPIK